MFVSDIYGPDCSAINLPGTLVLIKVICWQVVWESWENVLTVHKFNNILLTPLQDLCLSHWLST
jgi:hypothetical protein